MALSEGQVGPQQRNDGTTGTVRLGRSGESIVGFAGARYAEPVTRGAVYHAAMQAGGVLGTALTASAVTLTLYNPAGSGVNLVLRHASIGLTAAPAGNCVLVYAISANPLAAVPTATTAAVVRCNKLGPSAGKGVAYTAATLPAAPVIARVLANVSVNINAISGVSDEIDGALVLPENTAVTIQGIGSAVTGIVTFSWQEELA